MRSTFVTAMTLVTSTVTAQWYGPGEITVPEITYAADIDRFWLCSGPCCEMDVFSKTGTAIAYYDGVNRDTYQIQGISQEDRQAAAEAARLAAEAQAAAAAAAATQAAQAALQAAIDSATIQPTQTEPAQTEPAQTEPAQTEPAQTEPATTQPAQTEPAQTQPGQTQPTQTQPAQTSVATSTFKEPDLKKDRVNCYQRDTVLASTSLQGTYEEVANGYTMRLQMDLSIGGDDNNTVIDNQEVAMMTVCYPRTSDADVFDASTNLSFLPTYDCCQASYTLEDYITGNYAVTAQCYLSPSASSIKPLDAAALISSSKKRFQVCGAKLTDDLAAPTYEDVTLVDTEITLDETNTIGRTKSFAATFLWTMDQTQGALLAEQSQSAWIESSIYGRFLTNRRVLTSTQNTSFFYTKYDSSKAAGASFNPSELACGGFQSVVASLAVVATALSFLSF